jgi:UDP:flavonoid glycosyltransferase YjiC (YdhE family)
MHTHDSRPLKILLFANSVTITHLVRPLQIGRALAAAGHHPVLAAPDRWAAVLGGWTGERQRIGCPTPEAFMDALARGRPVFTEAAIRAMVEEDLRVIDEVRPDAVVGDFRISLGISARLRRVPYANLINAYWNPAAQVLPWPIPEHLLARLIGVRGANAAFRLVQPLIRRQHAGPLDAVRRSYGLPPLGDVRRAYCDADFLLHPDPPGLVRLSAGGPPSIEVGHLAWAPQQTLPPWWVELPAGRSCIYVGMGSSGSLDRLEAVVEGAARSGLPVVVTTAGRIRLRERANVHVADWLPGDQVAARARIVICNGGSPSAYQALAAGAPVIGLAANLDQYLAMGAVEQAGLGRRLRAGTASADRVATAIRDLLADEVLGHRVAGMAAGMAAGDPAATACAAIIGMRNRPDLRQVG